MFPFNFSSKVVILDFFDQNLLCVMFRFFSCYGRQRLPVFTPTLDEHLNEVSIPNSKKIKLLFDFAEIFI